MVDSVFDLVLEGADAPDGGAAALVFGVVE